MAEEKHTKFSKEDFLKSKRYQHKKDLLDALLQEDRQYTIQEVDSSINRFMKERME